MITSIIAYRGQTLKCKKQNFDILAPESNVELYKNSNFCKPSNMWQYLLEISLTFLFLTVLANFETESVNIRKDINEKWS